MKESKTNRDKAYRLRKKFEKGRTLSKADEEWISEYERRVLFRKVLRSKGKLPPDKGKRRREQTRTPTKKALQAWINAMKRFLSWYGIKAKKIEHRPYGSGIVITANVSKVAMADIDTSLDYPFDIIAKSLTGHIANIRVKLVSGGRFFRWKSLAPLNDVNEVFARAAISLVRWARMDFPSSFEFREEHIVIFDTYFRRETPTKEE